MRGLLRAAFVRHAFDEKGPCVATSCVPVAAAAEKFAVGEGPDLDQPVEVLWNGRTVHSGPVKRRLATLLEIAGEKCDWTATFEAALPLR